MAAIFLILINLLELFVIRSTEVGNLVRNAPSFQSSINSPPNKGPLWPYKAVDDIIALGNLNGQFECAYTGQDSLNYGWWIVDLKNTYDITRICLLNRGDSYYTDLKNFKIIATNRPVSGDENICSTIGGQSVDKALDINDYKCFTCPSSTVGSFVEIRKTKVDEFVGSLCDVRIYGQLIGPRASQLLNITQFKTFPHDLDIGKLNDFNLQSIWLKTGSLYRYFRIDFGKQIKINGVFIVGSATDYSNRKFTNVYVSISSVPETIFSTGDIYLANNYRSTAYVAYETHRLFVNGIITGRYLVISQNSPATSTYHLEITELSIYGYYDNISLGGRIGKELLVESIKVDGNDVTSQLTNGIYEEPTSVELKTNAYLEITITTALIDSFCMNAVHPSTTKDLTVEVVNASNGTIEIYMLNGGFKGLECVCVKNLSIITNLIKVSGKDDESITEIDVFGKCK
ncbi:DgyrCDS4136 [Dimorphilus gyrociliatus]|uniref:DgyrCDS4136 n=1 Tax=Dimorphilus gyrociliatus TaxID=2664684 RepID=A0A7I8VIN8_9ANNE|nr:DgyrCDS4136 [Dimorphilus gyrociliatus]